MRKRESELDQAESRELLREFFAAVQGYPIELIREELRESAPPRVRVPAAGTIHRWMRELRAGTVRPLARDKRVLLRSFLARKATATAPPNAEALLGRAVVSLVDWWRQAMAGGAESYEIEAALRAAEDELRHRLLRLAKTVPTAGA